MSQITVEEPIITQQPSPRPSSGSARALLPYLAVFILIAPAYAYYSYLLGLQSNSDPANNVLQGWDMFHGKPILNGWFQSGNSFITNEVPLYGMVALFVGVRPAVIYISQGIIYAAIIVLSAKLALASTKSKQQALIAAALVGVVLAAPTREDTGWMMLSLPDHLGTAIPLLIVLILMGHPRISPLWALAAFLVLTAALIGDSIAIYVGVIPIVITALVRAYQGTARRRYYLCIAACALASVALAAVTRQVIESLGGTVNTVPEAVFASVEEMPLNIWETIHGLMVVFGAALFGRSLADSPAQMAHLAMLGLALLGWILAIRRYRSLSFIDQVLIGAITVNVLAFMFSNLAGPFYTAHQMLIVVPFSAVLIARLLPPLIEQRKERLAVYACAALTIVMLAATLAGPRAADPTEKLTGWLRSQELRYGLAEYWRSSSVTVQSGNRVRVRPIIKQDEASLTPNMWIANKDWYNAEDNYANFFIYDTGPHDASPQISEQLLSKVFGPPRARDYVDDYVIYQYNYNILTRLTPPILPE